MRPLKISSEDALIEAALEVLTRNPGASLSQVALRAGVGRATLHRYFPSRESLLSTLATRAMDETDAATADLVEQYETGRERLRAMFAALIPLGSRFAFLRLAQESAKDPAITKRYRGQLQLVEQLVEQLREEGALAADVPTRWAVDTIDSLIWIAWTQLAGGHVTVEAATDLACRTLLTGLEEKS